MPQPDPKRLRRSNVRVAKDCMVYAGDDLIGRVKPARRTSKGAVARWVGQEPGGRVVTKQYRKQGNAAVNILRHLLRRTNPGPLIERAEAPQEAADGQRLLPWGRANRIEVPPLDLWVYADGVYRTEIHNVPFQLQHTHRLGWHALGGWGPGNVFLSNFDSVEDVHAALTERIAAVRITLE